MQGLKINVTSNIKVVSQPAGKARPLSVASAHQTDRRALLGAAFLAVLPAYASPSAEASKGKNLSHAEEMQLKKAQREAAMKERAAKLRSGEGKPTF
mmetsp:Transcript_15926/g.34406  ORF Transcript_15926/g.34406 Transcript_15926/m.34406 type:complete len:97 (+) Transcript_15926:81-371(+)|eukprot:CAMPEP_0202890792 /NCGR_PEP_ID=MMETSP1392-20130828/1090_1 /ASSEMBLY_ACC=CAM_ASM_000868 /TAXON_ID=225041 /ORGANISM="Chlamydomonas chlamydogama, Strain SAG 11-48b" /LENGTH=96 /DNA_ID=CAMNT_0049574429 /DNA_START=76 /DNA_END=366 /DNA_ORIENTATION=+